MFTPSESLNLADPTALLEWIDAIADRFEAAWQQGPPRIVDFLAPASEAQRSALLEELVMIDLEYRWRHGDRRSLEAYLDEFPELRGSNESLPNRLVRRERKLREKLATNGRSDALAPAPSSGSEGPTSRPDASRTGGAVAPILPTVLGYEIQRELGRGGMGVVYEARQLSLNRLVALKMILAGAHAGPDDVTRFRAEAEAVARLQHPNIVQIHDVGESAGCPYLALEFVGGGSLAQGLAGAPLPARQAAEFVETLAGAMQYAHQHGIVHRDLKPANILLAADPRRETQIKIEGEGPGSLICANLRPSAAKITDFGLAKRLEGEAGLTRSGDVLGTPSYMAPEQAEGRVKQIGPATDVYALGAILYELLTGRPPFRAATSMETLLQVKSQEPVSPRRLQPSVPRDLETICLKCLHKEPTKRYGTAAALAEDLQRFLAGKPIVARPVGLAGRLVRWCKRNPAVALLLASLPLFATVADIGLWMLMQQAKQHAAVAQRRLEENREAVRKHFIVLADMELSKEPGTQALQHKLLEEALGYFERFLQEVPDDPGLRADVADAHYRVGLITSKIGSMEKALTEYQQARDLLEQLVRNGSEGGLLVPRLIDVYCGLGGVQVRITGRSREALDSYQRGQQLCRQWLDTHVGDPACQFQLAESYASIGRLQRELGDLQATRSAFQTARDLLEQLVRADAAKARFQTMLADTYHNLGHLCQTTGQPAEALRCYRQALELRKVLAAAQPTMPDLQLDLAGSYGDIGILQCALNRVPDGLDSMQKSRQVLERLGQANPGVNKYQQVLARLHGMIGNVQFSAGQWPAALDSYEQARAILDRLVRNNPTEAQYQADLAASYLSLGNVYDQKGQAQEALDANEKGRAILEQLVRANPDVAEFHSRLAIARHNTGEVLQKLGRHQEALGAFQEAVVEQRVAFAKFPQAILYRQTLAGHYAFLAGTYRDLDRPVEAVAALLECKPLCAGDANQLYSLACDLALCVPLVGKSKTELSVEDQAQRQQVAQRAMEMLQLAIAQGFRDVQQLQSDPKLAPLRSHADFQRMLAAVPAKK